MQEKVILLKEIFCKTFVVSLIYYILITILYLYKIDWFVHILNTYYRVNVQDAYMLCGQYMSAVEIITMNLLLIPAIGLYWVSKTFKKEDKE